MADFGYDVSDYLDVDPLFGSLDDLDALVGEAHRTGLRVVMDWVPNHTSDRHPWFVESRSSRASPRRDWYVWADGAEDRPPNNWKAAFAGVGGTAFPPAWTWDEPTAQWYLHLFLAEQPDLNWANPQVVEAMEATLRFWLERGVDGFRVDVVHALAKPAGLADLPPELAEIPIAALVDEPAVHPLVERIRAAVKAAPTPERVLIGETVLPSVAQIAAYYGSPGRPELDLAFNFHPLRTRWDASAWRERIDEVLTTVTPRGWPAWVLSNHDNPRHRTRYGSQARARAAAVLLLALPGTPFLYAGEELGLSDAEVPPERRVDPGGRDGCRAPIPWDGGALHGWAADPWLPWPPEAAEAHAAAQDRDQGSTLNLYRRLISVRRGSRSLQAGGFEWLASSAEVLAWARGADRVAAVNFGAGGGWARLPRGRWEVEVSTTDPTVPERPGAGLSGRLALGAEEAVVLRRG
jgi:alpha-glucosidase